MRKNIRRSLIVAAAASGIWALGTAGANAAELPVSSGSVTGTVEKAGKGGLTGTVDDVTDTVRKTTEGVTRGVTEKLPTKGIPENGLPTNTLPTGELPLGDLPTGDLPTGDLPTDRVGGAVGDARSEVDKVSDGTGHAAKAAKAVKDAQKEVCSAAQHLPGAPALGTVPGIEVPQLPPRTLPVPALPAVPQVPSVPSAPATGDLVGGLAGASLRPCQLSGVFNGDHVQHTLGTVRTAVSPAQPVVNRVSATVLPPVGRSVLAQVRPVAEQAAGDAAVTVDDAAATSGPFVESTSVRAHTLTQDVTGDLGAFGPGVGADGVLYAHDLRQGLHKNVNGLAVHVISGVQVITVPSPRDLCDAANIPGLPVPSQLPAVPAV